MESEIRFAVVGAGWIAQEAFLPAAATAANARVTALVSGSAENAMRLAAYHGIENVIPYEEFDALMAGDEVDAVYIATPNALHADYAIRAAKAGKHVLCEKPLAASEAECEAILAAAAGSGAEVMTAYRLHTDPGTVDTMARIRAGEIGEPRVFSAIFTALLEGDNHRRSPAMWGGPLQDVGVYCLNAARHVFGCEPEAVVAMAGPGAGGDPEGVPDSVGATLMFPGGRIAQFAVSFGAETNDAWTVSGTKGSLRMDPGFRFEEPFIRALSTAEGRHRLKEFPVVDQFAGMITYFAGCLLSGRKPAIGPREGLADVRVLRAIERACATGMIQRLDPFPSPGRLAPGMAQEIALTDRRLVLRPHPVN